MSDTKHIRQRGDVWFAHLRVPTDVKPAFGGRSFLTRTLKTTSLRIAQQERHAVIAEWRDQIRRARAGRPGPKGSRRGLGPEDEAAIGARALASFWDQLCRDPLNAPERLGEEFWGQQSLDGESLDTTWLHPAAERTLRELGLVPNEGLVARVAEVIASAGFDALDRFRRGVAPPPSPKVQSDPGIVEAAERMLVERRDLKPRTVEQIRASARAFAEGYPGGVERIDRKTVAAFTARLEAADKAPGTINKHLAGLGSIWRWAQNRGLVDDDRRSPFERQHRPKPQPIEAPFEADELARLFAEPIEPDWLRWCVLISLYSGMRAGEVADHARLHLDPLPYFAIDQAKSAAGRRVIPVHSRLIELGLLDAASQDGPLFPDVHIGGKPPRRAYTLSKYFTRLRRKRGVVRLVEGKDALDFHSCRRTFVRALEIAGASNARVALIAGHSRGWSLDTYNRSGVALEQLREIVELVRYPELG